MSKEAINSKLNAARDIPTLRENLTEIAGLIDRTRRDYWQPGAGPLSQELVARYDTQYTGVIELINFCRDCEVTEADFEIVKRRALEKVAALGILKDLNEIQFSHAA